MKIILCNIPANPRKLDKRADFETAAHTELNCEIHQNCSVQSPVFLLPPDYATGYNYAYVQKWNRYYFISKGSIFNGKQAHVPGVCDVLTSFADEIKTLSAFVTRTENNKNSYLPDGNYHAQANRQCETITFNKTPFSVNYATDKVYLLTVMGGAHE